MGSRGLTLRHSSHSLKQLIGPPRNNMRFLRRVFQPHQERFLRLASNARTGREDLRAHPRAAPRWSLERRIAYGVPPTLRPWAADTTFNGARAAHTPS